MGNTDILNYINGEFVEPVSGKYLDNIAPATGKISGKIPASGEADCDRAYAAARDAFPAWSAMPAQERSAILLRLANLIDANKEKLAIAESEDSGKPLWLTRSVDIMRAAANIKFFAESILHVFSESHALPGEAINFTLRQPIGVVACISPWNLPLYLFTWKIAPALATGNTVVAKPSEVTPLTAYLFSQLCVEAGLPPGVLNVLHGHGTEIGKAMVAHPGIKAISFTGGTSTGREIARVAAPMFKKLSLELGGKNPNIIFSDCDFDQAVKQSVRAAFTNQGQICLCGSRIFVERSIYEKFKTAFVQEVKNIKVGNPMDDAHFMGAMVSEAHLEKVLHYIELAKEEGGIILCGGNRLRLNDEWAGGFYLEPTVIDGLAADCRTTTEEIFGPVVTITPFDSEEEALQFANGTEYGLAAMVWTSNLSRAHRVAEKLQSGIVWINCWMLRDLRTPFGGVKQSGVGREGGWEALRFFTEAKNVCIKYS